MAKSKKPKADKADKPKVDKTFDKRRKKARKEDMRWQKKMLRQIDYPAVLGIERQLLEESLALPDHGGIPKDRITELQRVFKKGRVPWTRKEVERNEKERHEAKEFIYQCREQAGLPVANKARYNGEMARTFVHQLIVDIRNGVYEREKPARPDKGQETGEEQAGAGDAEAWGGIGDDDMGDEDDEEEQVEGMTLEQVDPVPVSPGHSHDDDDDDIPE